ncbi:MAG: hypothetical protein JO345_36285 [Streptosporangiaceae bacterium]|nr:hypothetical protein [Streptosporangiaceae bacterium]
MLGEQVCELLEAQPHARRGDWPGLADALGDHQAGADGVDGDAQRPGLLGGALFALGKTAAYAKTRVVWGDTPIGAHQGVAHPLAQAAVQVELARLMAQKAAWLYDTGDDTRATAAGNMAKLAADAADAADQAVQTHGGGGLASEHGLARLLASARTARAAPVSREMILNFVAQHTLGLPKSY